MKAFFGLVLIGLFSHSAQATSISVIDLAKSKINTYSVVVGTQGAFPGMKAPSSAQLCMMANDALAGFGLLKNKSNDEIASIISFVNADQIDAYVAQLSDVALKCAQ